MKTPKAQYRFFLPAGCVTADAVTFPDTVTRQLTHVLRVSAGASVLVLDGSGDELLVELTQLVPLAVGRVVHRQPNDAEPTIHVALFQSMLKGRKLETVWQRCTELGVSSFTPVLSHRSVAESLSASRQHRLAEIVREAAEQSGRGKLPALDPAIHFAQALSARAEAKLLFTARASPSPESLRAALGLSKPSSVAILIGPEGGFDESEVREAVDSHWRAISLGPRTLRSETAAIAAISVVQHGLGQLD